MVSEREINRLRCSNETDKMLTGWKKEEAHRDVNAGRNILAAGLAVEPVERPQDQTLEREGGRCNEAGTFQKRFWESPLVTAGRRSNCQHVAQANAQFIGVISYHSRFLPRISGIGCILQSSGAHWVIP